MKIALRYTFFALLATIANIGSQDIVVRLYQGSFHIILALLIGTAVGLISKYWFDKKYIFGYQAENLGEDTRKLSLYTLTGIITTCIFWGLELTFESIYGTREMRYLGGIIGLAIGYIIKYQLDKRFVFATRNT